MHTKCSGRASHEARE